MLAALKSIGVGVRDQGSEIHIEPRPLRGGTINCGLAGTVMRFVPPVAAIATGTVFFDGDPQARTPMSTMLDALRDLGIQVQGDALPFIIDGVGTPTGGTVDIDASGSSQFVSGLLLAGARFSNGITVRHTGGKLPSMPHIEMTIAMLAEAGLALDVVLEITADAEVVVERLLKRATEQNRADDTESVIRRRLEVYAEQTEPLASLYEARGLLVRVDGIGDVDEVTERMMAALAARTTT